MIKLISDEDWDQLEKLDDQEDIHNYCESTIFISLWLKHLVDWFWLNKENILRDVEENKVLVGDRYGFEVFYPDYGGIPKKISKNLKDNHLAIINKEAVYLLINYQKERDFKEKFISVLTNSTVLT